MDVSEEFRRHAADCKRMAKSSSDLVEKVTWDQMAKRWIACAEYYSRRPTRFSVRMGSNPQRLRTGPSV
jgi:hypothetical protein